MVRKNRFLAFIFLLFLTSYAYSTVIHIPNEDNRFEPNQKVKAILAYQDGTIVEKEYRYDPQIEGIDVSRDEPILSIFFPDQNLRFLKWKGEWVDDQGYYWTKGKRAFVEFPEWEEHWNVYWDREWHQYWRDHWSLNQEKSDWPYRAVEHWHNVWHRQAH